MLVLALDTTTRQGSIALTRDGVLLSTFSGDAAVTHGERLPGDLMRVLQEHALRMTDVALFAVAAGPGSFTGLRIGIATMQGLSMANGKPLLGISALDAIHDVIHHLSPKPSALSPVSEVAIWMDAQRGQVFSAVYRNGEIREEPAVDTADATLSRWSRRGTVPAVFAGDGALVYRPVIVRELPHAQVIQELPPLAPGVARLAETRIAAHELATPDAVRPIYIRKSDAELARARMNDRGLSAPAGRSGADR